MADQKKHANLYLAPDSLTEAVELLFFAYRDFTGVADRVLAEHGLGRAHHRVIHFVHRDPGLSVSELLEILNITKQSLSRVLKHLVEQGYITAQQARDDGRRRQLRLTDKGEDLQRQLSAVQQQLILEAFEPLDGSAVDGFRQVLLRLIQSQQDRQRFEPS